MSADRPSPGPVAVAVDGRVRDPATATLPATAFGVRTGLGVFTTARARAGRLEHRAAHLRRVARDAAALGLAAPDGDELSTTVDAVLAAAGRADLAVRVVIVAAAPSGPAGAPTHVLVTATPSPDGLDAPVRAITRPGRRAHPAVKATSYLAEHLARREAQHAGVEETLLTDGPELLEGAGSNLVLVVDDAVVTPAADGRILPGVLRAAVLAAAASSGVPVHRRPVTFDDLGAAAETAVTSSLRGVAALTAVDERATPGRGPVLTALAAAVARADGGR
jgi:branched-chain amino acid aminotransferase